jgi:Type II CAAX prenyl endopeptidase Rce1-like
VEHRSAHDKQQYPWRLFFVLLAGSVLSAFALIPYVSEVIRPILAAHPLRLPLPLIILIQGTIYFGGAVSLGLLLGRKIGLGAPYLEAWLYGKTRPAGRGRVWVSCLTGLALGVVTVAVLRSPLGAALAALPVTTEASMPLWKRFLACFYGGLGEEIIMRLFLMSLVAWVLGKVWKTASGLPSSGVFWVANIVVAVAFGAGHLQLAAQLTPLTPLLVTTVISVNALVGVGFGYLYWKRGLESAMLAHFSVDIVLHVLGPMF